VEELGELEVANAALLFDVKNGHRLFDASGFVCEDDTDAIIRATVLFIWQSKASLWIFIWMTQL
jgi:hypothetical protein